MTPTPTFVGELVYWPQDGKMTLLVALHRVDTDRLDWFEVGDRPFFGEVIDLPH